MLLKNGPPPWVDVQKTGVATTQRRALACDSRAPALRFVCGTWGRRRVSSTRFTLRLPRLPTSRASMHLGFCVPCSHDYSSEAPGPAAQQAGQEAVAEAGAGTPEESMDVDTDEDSFNSPGGGSDDETRPKEKDDRRTTASPTTLGALLEDLGAQGEVRGGEGSRVPGGRSQGTSGAYGFFCVVFPAW